MSFGSERKRKRGRKPKVKVTVEGSEMGLEIVNRDGAMVDIESLASAADPYGEELRKRTEGLVTEEELLGFMRDLGGQWGSRRKRRKIVDACVLGDALPVGWKLLLGLKRKEGRASVYCRRYIRCLSFLLLQLLACLVSYKRERDVSLLGLIVRRLLLYVLLLHPPVCQGKFWAC